MDTKIAGPWTRNENEVAQRSSLEFSFSGLKTSLRYQLEKMSPADIERRKADLCASYQAAVFNALVYPPLVLLWAFLVFRLRRPVTDEPSLLERQRQVLRLPNQAAAIERGRGW